MQMDIRKTFETEILENPLYRCCPQNCHYFEFCVIQEGIKNVSCKDITAICKWYENTTGCWIDTLSKFKEAFEEAEKEHFIIGRTLYKHKCAYCGTIFQTVTYDRKYCSRKCMELARKHDETKVGKRIKRICVECGKEFWQIRNFSRVQKCCSLRCRGRHGNKKLQEKMAKRK